MGEQVFDDMGQFVQALMKSWSWAQANFCAVADTMLGNDASGAQTEKHQRRMMGQINKLTAASNGKRN